jgi:hypothetical protein
MEFDDVTEVDVPLDNGEGGAASGSDQGGQSDDGFGEMQSRMAGDDNPWYSPSEGKVVDKDGEVLTDPTTGEPFRSWEAFEKWNAKNGNQPATPKTNDPQKPTGDRAAENLFGSQQGGITPEQLFAMSKVGGDYRYADEMIPKLTPVKPGEAGAPQNQTPTDPIERVREERAAIEKVTVAPILKLRDLLIAQGAHASAVNELLAPVLKEQQSLVDSHYQQQYEKAMTEKAQGTISPELTRLQDERLSAASKSNIGTLASQYYPQGGVEQFFRLVNGSTDPKGAFVRGPASSIIDLMVTMANNGKVFATEQERAAAYTSTFRQVTADPTKARVLFDVVHNYVLGKQTRSALASTFEKGKAAAAAQNALRQKTIKTKPGSFSAPTTVDEDENMPSSLRAALMHAR